MKMVRLLSCFCLLLVSLLAVGLPGLAIAQDGTVPAAEDEIPPLTESITLTPIYPSIEAIAGSDFKFDVELLYLGEKTRVFDLRATAPAGWEVYMTPQYESDRKIASISLQPAYATGEKIKLVATAPFWPLPEPGSYKITLEGISDTVKSRVELNAVITAKYSLDVVPSNTQYNTVTRAGKDNPFSIKVRNLGTGAVDNVNFQSTKPDGWEIKFTPDKVDVLDAIDEKEISVNIIPPAKTVAGDYIISLTATGKQINAQDINIRVTVETPTIWGWVGVGIILVVVVGLIVIFMRFSRR